MQTELIKVLALPRDAAPPDGCSGMVALAFKWRDMALLDGDTRALVEIRNTIDGLPRVDVDVDVNQRVTFVIGDFGEPVVINGMTSPISLPDFGDGDAGN